MDTNQASAPAEIFSAAVATTLPAESGDLSLSDTTYCGGGMARVHDD